MPAAQRRRLHRTLAAWFDAERRDLPWRREPRDPWAVLVSEIMLQQTRVDVVAPRFEGFLERWPTPAAMAADAEDDVVAAWTGLGYYRRARNLHRAAVAIATGNGGVFPADEAGLRSLPGVGAYTAGAVGSLALGLPLPVVDGNVERVLARLFAVRGDPRRGAAARRIRELAAALVPATGAGEWNEGLMELGALVCVPRRPRCDACPLARDCAARAAGLADRLPEREKAAPVRRVRMAAALVRDRAGAFLLLRRPDGGRLGGTWELPQVEVAARAAVGDALGGFLTERLGGAWTVGERVAEVRHGILDRDIRLEAYVAERTDGRRPRRSKRRTWARTEDLAALPISSLVEKTLRAARQAGPASDDGPPPGAASSSGRTMRRRRA